MPHFAPKKSVKIVKNGKAKNSRERKKLSILISAKQNKVGIRAARRLEKELSKFADVHFDKSTAQKLMRWRMRGIAISKFKGDLIITLGGDGTFLWTAYQSDVPILPVRIEGHGFLCTTDYKDLLANMKRIEQRKWVIMKRMRLQATKLKPGIIEKFLHRNYPCALNEIAFARKRPSKVLKVEFVIDGTPFSFWGDGLMFATPAGSTAYASSAGGPLIDPSLEAIAIVPLYPFHSKIKPMLVPATKRIEVRIRGGDCALIVDGHTGEYVKAGANFIVERGKPVEVATLGDVKFYERYRYQFIENEAGEL
ncbi:MAG: NAD(+)/NADH kinase [Candidatus Aenigmatarchaeota archaeon]